MNYNQIYARKEAQEKRIKSVCPNAPETSGIYILHDLKTGLNTRM